MYAACQLIMKYILGTMAFFMVVFSVFSIFTSDLGQNTNDILSGFPILGDILDGQSMFGSGGDVVRGAVTIAFAAILGTYFHTAPFFWGKVIEEIIITIVSAGITKFLAAQFGSGILAVILMALMVFVLFRSSYATRIWAEILKKGFIYLLLKAVFHLPI